ncbi:MAG: hypothetical protein CMO30_16395 [Tistrella sp.]|jgi:predicted negative regulator of RcsB-dependent stress response|nr:hypothetical protein [Tistrella sp.]MAD38532.1 hypothetical protein [Tistrella sp.]MBA76851.1 hypothetical protein [Tistrella sp.]|tara:strand:- start:12 stop:155 length:144 start_codon:yes stop_codon:yes gene_type:complete
MSRNVLYLIIGALLVVVAVGGYQYYEESQKSGVEVEVGNGGLSVETK